MNAVQTFNFGYGQDVRVVELDGAPLWVLKDVAKILGYRDSNNARQRLQPAQYKRLTRSEINNLGLPTSLTSKLHEVRGPGTCIALVTEPGLYRLILRSDHPEARRFQTWVESEVLPSIRRTGGYKVEEQTTFDFAGRQCWCADVERLLVGLAFEISEVKATLERRPPFYLDTLENLRGAVAAL